jgi:N-acetylmuramoyl-L-alanine amidase
MAALVGGDRPDNFQEKTVTSAVALKTKSMLEQAGRKYVLTRNDDRVFWLRMIGR